ncbi:MAG: succinate dehydrogenase/fumarate reductase iron-sulfur subunit [Desulfobulbaceae bacterium]|nr:succinate dehydrogenase/fumarate reductase iron-sulfur subunit [Desulfobulbaceae bacterium]
MPEKKISLILKIWRQKNPDQQGKLVTYELSDISSSMSFLEMLDLLNEQLTIKAEEPVAFDNDCREGICGKCGAMVNGTPHGPERETTLCQLHMRHFKDGDTIYIEPFRSVAFPLIKDLVIDRSALDTVIMAGGYISVNAGSAVEANTHPVGRDVAEQAMDSAACIGCGACVAACPNASAMLFTGAKITQLALLPQGQPERKKRAASMVKTMDKLGFGGCTNIGECEKACPKNISITNIARLNHEYMRTILLADEK